jgi:hypothetical protein
MEAMREDLLGDVNESRESRPADSRFERDVPAAVFREVAEQFTVSLR